MLLLVIAGYAGAALTAGVLWSSGALVALAAAPFGASLGAVAAGAVIAWRRPDAPAGEVRTDEMVAALRAASARAHRPDPGAGRSRSDAA